MKGKIAFFFLMLAGVLQAQATITIYCEASSAPKLHAWDKNNNNLNGDWWGDSQTMTTTTTVKGHTFYYKTFNVNEINVIFHDGNGQTEDIKGITSDTYFDYQGGSTYTNITQSLAEAWRYNIRTDHNSWGYDSYILGETSNASDQITWKVQIPGNELEYNNDGNGIGHFSIGVTPQVNGQWNTGNAYSLVPSSNNYVLARETGAIVTKSGEKNSFKVENISSSGTYTITFNSGAGSGGDGTRNQGTVSISGPEVSVENTSLVLRGSFSGDDWGTEKSYTSFDSSNGIYTWEFTPSEFPSKTEFKMFDKSESDNEKAWYGANGWGTDSNGNAVTKVDESWRTMYNNKAASNMTVSYDETDMEKITILVRKSGANYQIKIYYTPVTHDYYWVSPQVTNNQKLEKYKMVASRNRSGDFGDGMISTRYYSLTMKADDIRKYDGTAMSTGEEVQWYIVRDDNEVWYRPTDDNPEPTSEHDELNVGGGDSNVGYRNFESCKTNSLSTTGCFSFLKGYSGYNTSSNKAVSYTFILNSQKSSDAGQGNVYFNYAKGAATITDYFLIGNFRSASEGEYIDISDTSHPMTKYWYKNGVASETEVADADSIVYKIDVKKPTAGWGNLYLDINPSGNTTNDTEHWKKVLRPLISLGNTLDGRAFVGGVTTAGSDLANAAGDQSLNPETTDNYTGYTFSFNATTYTYRLEFHTSLYLVGDGVSASEGTGSWNISNVESSDPRIRLNATQEAGHYRNRVYFTQGKQFRFIRNTDETDPTYQTTWHENDHAPKFSSATDNDSEYTPGNETQYKNALTYQTDGSGNGSGNTAPSSGTNITFDLPTGWYYINFYENTGSTPYYIIERQIDLRDFNEVHYKNGSIEENRTITGRGDYNFFRVWSDHIAWTKPDDIDVFVVTEFSVDENGQATAVLTKQSGDYIPAKTGVILASKDTKDTFHSGVVYKEAESGTSYNTAWMDMTPAEAPATTYGGDSKLTPLYDATNLHRYETVAGTEYANYLFGFYRLNKVIQNYDGAENDFGLGFWLTTGEGNTYANSAFLRIQKSDAESLGVGTTYTTITDENSSAPAFFLVFEDEPEPETVTAIQDVRQQHVGPEGWFTLNGLRVTYPTAKGVYIHNGKKIVVK